LGIPNDVHHVSDEKLEQEILDILDEFPLRTMDRAVAEGDVVNVDYVGRIDGVIVRSSFASGMYLEVILGATNLIDEFVGPLIGHIPGDTINVE